MTGMEQALARREVCEAQQQPATVVDRHEATRRASLALVPKMDVAVPKQGSVLLLFKDGVREGLIEVFEAFEDNGVPYVWVRFVRGRNCDTVKQLKYVATSNSPGWRDAKALPQCTAGYYCVRHAGPVFSFR